MTAPHRACYRSTYLASRITGICFPECASRISRCVLVLHVYCVVALYKHTIVTGMTQGFQNCAWIRFWIRNRSCGYEKRQKPFFIVRRFKFEFLHLNFSIWSSVFDGLSNESGLVPPRSGSSKLQLRHLRALLCNVPFSVLVASS